MQICSHTPARTVLILFAVLAALALAACGDDGGASSDLGPDPATVAPADVSLYFEAVVRPEGDQKESLLAALSKVTNSDDPGALINSAIERGLSEQGFSYSEDVEPWLGQRAGAFLTELTADGGDGAVAVAVTDIDAARSAIQKAADADDVQETDATYQGVDYQVDQEGAAVGIVGDFLVAGTKTGFEAAVDASNDASLTSNLEATDALDSVPSDSLFSTYIDAAKLVDLAVESGAVTQKDLEAAAGDQLDSLDEGPVVISGGATADSFSIEASGPGGSDSPGDLVSGLPAEAWMAIGVPMIGEAISTGYQSFVGSLESGLGDLPFSDLPGADVPSTKLPDVEAELKSALGLDIAKDFAWAGDLAVFVQGSSLFDLGGAIVIDTDDEQAASAALVKLRKAIQGERGIRVSTTPDGFQIQLAGAPVGADVAVRDGKVVVAVAGVTVDEVLSPSEALADSDTFQSASGALGEGLEASLYLAFPPIVGLLESSGQTGDPSYQQAKPVLDALNYLVAGSGTDGDRAVGRLVLGLRDDGSSSSAAAAAIAP